MRQKVLLKRSLMLILLVVAASCGADPAASGVEGTEVASQPVVVGDAFAGPGGPSGAFGLHGLYLAFTGTDNRINIVFASDSGTTFSSPRPLDERAPMGASLYAFGRELYLAWFGSDGQFNSLRSSDGLFWSDKQTFRVNGPGNHANGQPALISFNGSLRAFYAIVPDRGGFEQWAAHGQINQRIMGSDKRWSPAEGFRAETTSSPSAGLLGTNGDLLVVWTHRDMRSLRTKRNFREVGWAQTNTVDRHHEGSLFIAPFEDESRPWELYWLYRETEGPETDVVKLDRTDNGVDFQWILNTPHTSPRRPWLLWGASDRVAWSHYGADGDRSLNFNWTTF